ncbi:MAG: hypothetical protein JEZ02_00150 [Desulfatibacillum sp.]|nr:hypothetical protein [Desulfatibacillum sp.]
MPQIIIREPALFSPDSTLLMGDARAMMGKEVMGRIRKVVDSNQNKKAYYLLVASRQDPMDERRIRTTIVLSSAQPPKMLGTMCFFIDNRNSRAKRLWVLPLDRPSIIKAPPAELVPEIARIARHMPIIHG